MKQITNAQLIIYIRWLENNLNKYMWNVTGVDNLATWYTTHFVGNIRLGSDGRFWLMNKRFDYEEESIRKQTLNELKREVPWLYWGEEE